MGDTSIDQALVSPVAPPFADLRDAPRFTLLLRTAKLVCGAGEFLCIVRDISATGASLRCFHPLPQASAAVLEMQNGDRHQVERMWQRGDSAGFRFADSIDVPGVLQDCGPFPKRPVRLNLELAGTVQTIGGDETALICDLSQQGARVVCDAHLAIAQRLRLSAPGLPDIAAIVRWRRPGVYGLAFVDTFGFAQLALLAGRLQLG